MKKNGMKKILLIGTGGTIASHKSAHGLTPMLSLEELLSHVPAIRTFAEVSTVQLFSIDSTNMRPKHWVRIAKCIQDHYDQYDGFVVCHGTDTMAYTAAALSYMIQHSPKPIIITGSQKPIEEENTDARTNLEDSVRYAASDQAHSVTMVFDGHVIAGTRARKMRSKSYNAFDSINFPYVAVIRDEQVVQFISDAPEMKGPVFQTALNENIFVYKLIPGQSPDVLLRLKEMYDGFIIESFGVGGLPWEEGYSYSSVLEALEAVGKIIVMATQVTHEGSNMMVYEVGRVAMEAYDLIETYDMTLEAAVTKLMWAMGQTSDFQEVRRLFYTTINHDILFQHR